MTRRYKTGLRRVKEKRNSAPGYSYVEVNENSGTGDVKQKKRGVEGEH